jgi:hypothetical protein
MRSPDCVARLRSPPGREAHGLSARSALADGGQVAHPAGGGTPQCSWRPLCGSNPPWRCWRAPPLAPSPATAAPRSGRCRAATASAAHRQVAELHGRLYVRRAAQPARGSLVLWCHVRRRGLAGYAHPQLPRDFHVVEERERERRVACAGPRRVIAECALMVPVGGGRRTLAIDDVDLGASLNQRGADLPGACEQVRFVDVVAGMTNG